jgi:hypothetical protein
MHMKETARSILLKKHNYMVTINPNIDSAIVSLIAILDDIN